MVEIALDYPVKVNGVAVDTLQMRRPKVRDMIAAEKGGGGNAETEVRLFANLCEVAPAVIEDVDMADYTRLQEEYTGFLSQTRKPAGGE